MQLGDDSISTPYVLTSQEWLVAVFVKQKLLVFLSSMGYCYFITLSQMVARLQIV
jgi:hypothetical protein